MGRRPVTMDDNSFHFRHLWLEQSDGVFVKKFFKLNAVTSRLLYYPDNSLQSLSSLTPEGCFDISFLSLAADASSCRPKVLNCFYIIVSGTKHFLKAESEREKNIWIKKLQEASKIQVPNVCVNNEANVDSGYKVEVIAGVVVKSDIEEPLGQHDGKKRILQIVDTSNVIKCGFCVKQGIIRKSWKTRFFKLTMASLQYSKAAEDLPIRTIFLIDVIEIRPSVGIHLSRQNIFEVVTMERVFYIQAPTSIEKEEWMKAISKCLLDIHGPKSLETGIQTESQLASSSSLSLKPRDKQRSIYSPVVLSSKSFSV